MPAILRRPRVAGAILVAALTGIGGLVAAGAPPASAAAAHPAAARAAASTKAGIPAVWPTPRQETARPGVVFLGHEVTEVISPDTDADALTALATVLHQNGVRQIRQVQPGGPVSRAGVTCYVGTPAGNPAVTPELNALGAQGPEGLAASGYVLAAGHHAIVLAGADATGTYDAVQTLRQLIQHRMLHSVVIRDWPAMAVRGTIEGFYGPAWSDANITAQLRFYGANKLNTFVYSAKGDPYLRADWPQLYPPAQLSALTKLVTTARSRHVQFVYALSPGLSICYSDPTDLAELEAKDQQLWNAGVRQFALFFDDISSGFNCPADTTAFGSSADPLAAAQAYLINKFVTGFVDTHPGAQELITVPTDYAGDADSAYREVWKASLTPDVLVYWTGVGVIPQTISAAQASATAAEFGHQILVWDNYPVNDYQPTRLFLGPLVGRAADLSSQVAGFTSNPMQEAAPSAVPLFTTADYTWNPAAYDDAPQAAWDAGIDSYGGRAAAALQVFAETNQSTPRIGTLPESPRLASLISAFWAAYTADSGTGITPGLRRAAAALTAAWDQIAVASRVIDRRDPHRDFTAEAAPWLRKSGVEGQAGATAVRYLLATKAGAAGAAGADQARLTALGGQAAAIPVVVGEGVFQAFMLRADPSYFDTAVALYAATPADYQAALAAASAAGIPAAQVTQSFATAWNEAGSGEYLVMTVGGSADDALYFNACGWTNPSGLPGGSTPFDTAASPLNSLPGMNYYQNAAGQTAADTAQLAADLAYYATHGHLPAGVTSLPAAAGPADACSGTPGS
jgi:hyaluronoglucosaminidase